MVVKKTFNPFENMSTNIIAIGFLVSSPQWDPLSRVLAKSRNIFSVRVLSSSPLAKSFKTLGVTESNFFEAMLCIR